MPPRRRSLWVVRASSLRSRLTSSRWTGIALLNSTSLATKRKEGTSGVRRHAIEHRSPFCLAACSSRRSYIWSTSPSFYVLDLHFPILLILSALFSLSLSLFLIRPSVPLLLAHLHGHTKQHKLRRRRFQSHSAQSTAQVHSPASKQ